ncbi:hypothetical protein BDM02DRAFT_3187161 [Thelephora ganbajun]|uniref:Uncharacterized protein n=1 Tax=Thelephora ganbajun TaxID=370292 RepID=A0ACB6ZG61_THEGA|nr:hypothetical protein BDM02DRAFT_3187161 [Thelephora ganbajun]
MSIGTLPVWCLRDGKPSTCDLLRIGTFWRSPSFEVMMEVANRVVKYGIVEEQDWSPMYGMYYQVSSAVRLPDHSSPELDYDEYGCISYQLQYLFEPQWLTSARPSQTSSGSHFQPLRPLDFPGSSSLWGFDFGHANPKAAKKAAERPRQKAGKAYNPTKTKTTNRLPTWMSILKGSKNPVVELVPELSEEVKEELPTASPQSPPNVSRVISHRCQRKRHCEVRLAHSTAGHSIAHSSIHPGTDRPLIPKDDFSSFDRDEFRFAGTFNYSGIMRYLVLVGDALDTLIREKDEKKRLIPEVAVAYPVGNIVFPPGALISIFDALIFATVLRCGTVAAAPIMVFTLRSAWGAVLDISRDLVPHHHLNNLCPHL